MAIPSFDRGVFSNWTRIALFATVILLLPVPPRLGCIVNSMSSQAVAREAPRLVPWTTWDEWKQVMAWLWSATDEDQKKGLKRVRPSYFGLNTMSSQSLVNLECTY